MANTGGAESQQIRGVASLESVPRQGIGGSTKLEDAPSQLDGQGRGKEEGDGERDFFRARWDDTNIKWYRRGSVPGKVKDEALARRRAPDPLRDLKTRGQAGALRAKLHDTSGRTGLVQTTHTNSAA